MEANEGGATKDETVDASGVHAINMTRPHVPLIAHTVMLNFGHLADD